MTRTCKECGTPSGPYPRCQTHRLAHRNNDTIPDGGHTSPDDVTVECVECNTTYEHPHDPECPECGETRRRYVGPLEGDQDDQGSSGVQLREGETRDRDSHAARNAEMLRRAQEELDGEDGGVDE